MTVDKKPVTTIDIKKLRTSFEKAKLERIEKEKRYDIVAKAQKIADDDKLFNAIVVTINDRLAKAAIAEKQSIIVWSMGEFGHCNSTDMVDETPINREVFARVDEYCKASGIVTERKRVERKETHSTYIYFELHASWS